MPTVSINAPKTPVTKGSNGVAAATLPNVCKMPGPPAPFVPTPLPNIGMSGKQPKGYSKTVLIEGQPVAIQGASFGSTGDIASKGTGGGLISSNAEGPTKFIGPGSMDVKMEGKGVHLLGDPTFNNCGPAGSPANSATMAGVMQPALVLQATAAGATAEVQHICDIKCDCQAQGQGQRCISKKLDDEDRAQKRLSTIKSEVPYDMKSSPPTPFMKSFEKDGTPLSGPLRPSTNWFRPHRRPDAVVVADRALPPYGENIKAVVEVKLKGDPWRDGQLKAYTKIAGGDEDKVIEVNDNNCTCPEEEKPEPVPLPAPARKRVKRELPEASPLPWKPIATTVAAVATVALAVAAVASAPAVAVAAAAVAVFGLFTATSAPSSGGSDVI